MRTRAIAARSRRSRGTSQDGYAMAALLVAMSVMAVFMTVALPVWNTQAQREKEAELVFRGEQYARAIRLFQAKTANTLPPSVDVLLTGRYLRKKYKDPVTGGEFQLLSGASVQANAGVPGGNVGGAARPGGQVVSRGSTGTTGAGGSSNTFGQSGTQSSSGSRGASTGSPGGFGLGAGVGAGAGGTVPGGIMGVTSTSAAKSLRLYNGRGVYNEWTFVPVQRTLNAGGGAQGADTPGGPGRAGRGGGRGSQTPGRGSDGFRPGGGTGGGNSPFRPPTGTFGSGQQGPGGQR